MDYWWGECPKCKIGEMYGDEFRQHCQCSSCGYKED